MNTQFHLIRPFCSHCLMLGLSTITIYGYNHTEYGWLMGRANHPCTILYHFDRVFTISENLLSEKAENLTFDLWWILNRSIFLAVTRDWTPGRNGTVYRPSRGFNGIATVSWWPSYKSYGLYRVWLSDKYKYIFIQPYEMSWIAALVTYLV